MVGENDADHFCSHFTHFTDRKAEKHGLFLKVHLGSAAQLECKFLVKRAAEQTFC